MAAIDFGVGVQTPANEKKQQKGSCKSSSASKSSRACPLTPEVTTPPSRRVTKRLSFGREDNPKIPSHESPTKKSRRPENGNKIENEKTPLTGVTKSVRRSTRLQKAEEVEAPVSPPRMEPEKKSIRKKSGRTPAKSGAKTPGKKKPPPKTPSKAPKSKCVARKTAPEERTADKNKIKGEPKFLNKVVFDGVEFRVGDCVYVRRRDSNSESDDDELECEECHICKKTGRGVMVECDECLGGFHLSCLKPPLKEVPKDKWLCPFCLGDKVAKTIQRSQRRKVKKTAREKLLSSQMWAARIERLWKEQNGSYWFRGRWYIVPEETTIGRQPHNLKRELFLTNHYDVNEMESILRHCYVKGPKDFEKCTVGDDVFLCEYEYDVHWQSFKRLADADVDAESLGMTDSENDWDSSEDSGEDEVDEEEKQSPKQVVGRSTATASSSQKSSLSSKSVNTYRGRIFGLEKFGTKKIPYSARCRQQTDLDKAKGTLMLAASPVSLPCRNKEIDEITGFVTGVLAAGNQCQGRCLYIHGVPGTGKTATVLTVMKNLRTKVDAKIIQPYRFVEINGLKLAQPENLYKVLYEALTGHRVGWKRALQLLNQRFSESKQTRKNDDQPCVLLIDELDLLVTRNQSVLYNIFDWPTRAHSRLIVIGIANTMDLPEKLLPRIASRMGMQRLCFGPYSYQQLQEIISSRLNGIDAFEKQAVEFASRKVAAVSGDARRALELCRRAAELAEYRLKQSSNSLKNDINKLNSNGDDAIKTLVGMADIEAAIQEMFQAPHIQIMRRCSRLAKVFLIAMVYEYFKTGMSETTFEKLAISISFLCTTNGEHCPNWDTLFSIGCRLGACRILLCEPGCRHRLQKLQLNFPSDDVSFALRDDKDLPWASKYL